MLKGKLMKIKFLFIDLLNYLDLRVNYFLKFLIILFLGRGIARIIFMGGGSGSRTLVFKNSTLV